MKKRKEIKVSKPLMIAVALSFIFIFVLNSQPAMAVTEITACGSLGTPNEVYTLTANLLKTGSSPSNLYDNHCLTVSANNITIDCQGHSITYGPYEVTAIVSGYLTTIKNCRLLGHTQEPSSFAFDYIAIEAGSNNLIFNNTLIGTYTHNGVDYGIYLNSSSSNNIIINNTITNNQWGSSYFWNYGIYLSGASNNTIKNNTITSYTGIYLDSISNNNNNINNKITSDYYGISLSSSSNNNNINNKITSVYNGISLYSSSNNNRNINNTIKTSGSYAYGIYLNSSSNNTFTGNKANTSATNSYVLSGTASSHYNNSIDSSNFAEGKRVNYTYNKNNLIFNNVDFTKYGQVIFAWSRNITITNSNFSRDALNLFYTNASRISNNRINTTTGYGIFLLTSSNRNNISKNRITASGSYGHGIYLDSSRYNNDMNNTIKITGSYGNGILLSSSSSNNNINNTITTSGYSNSYGISMSSSDYNKNINNKITTSGDYYGDGILLSSSSSNNNTNNTITTSGLYYSYGIYLYSSSNNNNNINNTITTSCSYYGYGISLSSSSNNNNLNNKITTSRLYGNGIILSSSSSNRNINNTIKTSGNTAHGIYLSSTSNGNKNTNNTINTTGNSGYGIYISSSLYNSNLNNRITFSGDTTRGISLDSTSNSNNMTDNLITATSSSDGVGIYVLLSKYNIIRDNVLDVYSVNTTDGIELYTSTNNKNINNTITINNLLSNNLLSRGRGIYIHSISNSNININNTIKTPGYYGYGFYITSSTNNTLKGNKANTSQTNSYAISGTASAHYNHSIDTSNLAEGKPVNYTYNKNGLVFNNVNFANYGQVIFAWSRNITINNSNFSRDALNLFNTNTSRISNNRINTTTGYGIWLYTNSTSNRIINNRINTSADFGYGIFLQSSSNTNKISNNAIKSSGSQSSGIYLVVSSNNNATDNIINITNSYGSGIYSSGNRNKLNNNTITALSAQGYGIFLSISSNNSLDSNRITTSGSYFGFGIELRTSCNSNNISRNMIRTLMGTGYGIHSSSSSRNRIYDNMITTSNSNAYGIYLLSSSMNNNLKNNTIKTSGSGSYGFFLDTTSNNNKISNSTITTSGTNGYGVFFKSGSDNNTFSSMDVRTNGTTANAVFLGTGSHSFTISDSILNASKGVVAEFYINSSVTGGTWNFTNVTGTDRKPIAIYWTTGSTGTLNMHWRLDVRVRNTTGPLQGANVTSYNKLAARKFSELTGSSGMIARKTLLEYKRYSTSGTQYTWSSPYNASIYLAGYSTYLNKNINLSNNIFLDINLACFCPIGQDWIVKENCYMSGFTCDMSSNKITCLNSGSLKIEDDSIITAKKVITPVGHGCLYIDDASRFLIKK